MDASDFDDCWMMVGRQVSYALLVGCDYLK